MSAPPVMRTVEHRPTRSLLTGLAVVVVLAVGLGRFEQAAGQLPQFAVHQTRPPVELDMATVPNQDVTVPTSRSTSPTSTRVATPARPSPGCANPPGPDSVATGITDVPVVSGGEQRTYARTTRIGGTTKPTPLVVLLDDGYGDPSGFVVHTRWDSIARSSHLIVVAPRWNRRDDEPLAADAIVDVALRTCVDLARVYLVGFSTGAALATRVACEHPELVTAVVAVSGLTAPDRCTADVRVPVLAVHGALDPVVSTLTLEEAARAWARQDHCQPQPTTAIAGWNVSFWQFKSCDGRGDVQVYVLSDMGHEWPERVADPITARRWADLISTSTIAMSFFESTVG